MIILLHHAPGTYRGGQSTHAYRQVGMTLIELLCVMAIIMILVALLLPAFSQASGRARRVRCLDHLHEAGIAFQSFAHDHESKFPMQVSTVHGGSAEFLQAAFRVSGPFYFSYKHFQALGGELGTPKVIICPADDRSAAASFNVLSNANLSYFVGANADPFKPNSILAGDRNLTNDSSGSASIVRLGPNQPLHWTRELHHFKGNLLFADGRTEEVNSVKLKPVAANAPAVAELFLPVVPSSSRAGSGGASGVAAVPPAATALPVATAHDRHDPPPAASVTHAEPGPEARDSGQFSLSSWMTGSVAGIPGLWFFLLLLLLLMMALLGLEFRRRLRVAQRRGLDGSQPP